MRKIMIIIIALISVSAIAQTNVVQEGYYEMIDESGNVFDSKASEKEVIQAIYNYYINTGKTASYTTPKVRIDFGDWLVGDIDRDTIYVDVPTIIHDTIYLGGDTETRYVDYIQVEGKDYKVSEIDHIRPNTEVDTIDVTECFEDYNKKIWLYPIGDSEVGGEVWIPFKEIGLAKVEIDSMPIWKKKYQDKYRLQRTKHYDVAHRTYKELEMPFQFMNDSIVSIGSDVVRVRVFATEDWSPTLYVEDQLWLDLPDAAPGYQDFDGFETRRHTITFNGLLPDTEYTLKVIGHSRLRKEDESIYFIVKTLP